MARYQFGSLTVVIKNLIIINVVVWLIESFTGYTEQLTDFFALHDLHSSLFKPHQLITHMFMHDPTGPWHVLLNMFGLWMFGSRLEEVWGPKRFLTFYLVSGLGAAICHLTVLWFQNEHIIQEFNQLSQMQQQGLAVQFQDKLNEATLGASGAVFGCLAGFGYLFPNTPILIYGIVPMKAKWFVLLYAVIELFSGVKASAGDNVAHFAHLGGALAGLLMVLWWNRTNKRTFY